MTTARATRFINAIAGVIEGRESSFENTLQAFSLYWASLIRASGMTLFYIGKVDKVKQLAANNEFVRYVNIR